MIASRSETPSAGRAPGRVVAVLGLAALLVGLISLIPTDSQALDQEISEMIDPRYGELFTKSQSEKKGLTLYVKGTSLVGYVTAVDDDFVELRSQEFSRIVVRIDRIDGMAIY